MTDAPDEDDAINVAPKLVKILKGIRNPGEVLLADRVENN
jgi:hypothetical protein